MYIDKIMSLIPEECWPNYDNFNLTDFQRIALISKFRVDKIDIISHRIMKILIFSPETCKTRLRLNSQKPILSSLTFFPWRHIFTKNKKLSRKVLDQKRAKLNFFMSIGVLMSPIKKVYQKVILDRPFPSQKLRKF